MNKYEKQFNDINILPTETEQELITKHTKLKTFYAEVAVLESTSVYNGIKSLMSPDFSKKDKQSINELKIKVENAIKTVEDDLLKQFYTEVEFELLTGGKYSNSKLCILDTYKRDIKYYAINLGEGNRSLPYTIGTFVSREDQMYYFSNNKYDGGLALYSTPNVMSYGYRDYEPPVSSSVPLSRSQIKPGFSIYFKNDDAPPEMTSDEITEYKMLVILDEYVEECKKGYSIETWRMVINMDDLLFYYQKLLDAPTTPQSTKSDSDESQISDLQQKIERFNSLKSYNCPYRDTNQYISKMLKDGTKGIQYPHSDDVITAKRKLYALKFFAKFLSKKQTVLDAATPLPGGRSRKRSLRKKRNQKKSRRNRKR